MGANIFSRKPGKKRVDLAKPLSRCSRTAGHAVMQQDNIPAFDFCEYFLRKPGNMTIAPVKGPAAEGNAAQAKLAEHPA